MTRFQSILQLGSSGFEVAFGIVSKAGRTEGFLFLEDTGRGVEHRVITEAERGAGTRCAVTHGPEQEAASGAANHCPSTSVLNLDRSQMGVCIPLPIRCGEVRRPRSRQVLGAGSFSNLCCRSTHSPRRKGPVSRRSDTNASQPRVKAGSGSRECFRIVHTKRGWQQRLVTPPSTQQARRINGRRILSNARPLNGCQSRITGFACLGSNVAVLAPSASPADLMGSCLTVPVIRAKVLKIAAHQQFPAVVRATPRSIGCEARESTLKPNSFTDSRLRPSRGGRDHLNALSSREDEKRLVRECGWGSPWPQCAFSGSASKEDRCQREAVTVKR